MFRVKSYTFGSRIALLAAVGLASVSLIGCGNADEQAAAPQKQIVLSGSGSSTDTPVDTSNLKPYPFDKCMVSGEALGSMGTPKVIAFQGYEVKLCCSDCERMFKDHPEKMLAKLTEASAAKADVKLPSLPDGHDHAGHSHDTH